MDNYTVEELRKNFLKNNSELISLKFKTVYNLNKNRFFGLDWSFELNIIDFIVKEKEETTFVLEFLNVKEYKSGLDDFEKELLKFLTSYHSYLDEKKRKYPTAKETEIYTHQSKPEKELYPVDRYWFIVGVKLATGELQQIYTETNNNATQTAIKLGNKNLRPYISESMSNTNTNDKNIFSRGRKEVELIINYCKENNHTVCKDFENKLPNLND